MALPKFLTDRRAEERSYLSSLVDRKEDNIDVLNLKKFDSSIVVLANLEKLSPSIFVEVEGDLQVRASENRYALTNELENSIYSNPLSIAISTAEQNGLGVFKTFKQYGTNMVLVDGATIDTTSFGGYTLDGTTWKSSGVAIDYIIVWSDGSATKYADSNGNTGVIW